MIRSGKYRKVLNLIDHLPPASHTRAAFARDPEHVAQVLEVVEAQPKKAWAPPAEQYDLTAALLTQLVDSVNQNTVVTALAAGSKQAKIDQMPRPQTLFDVIQEERREAKHKEIVGALLPHKRVE